MAVEITPFWKSKQELPKEFTVTVTLYAVKIVAKGFSGLLCIRKINPTCRNEKTEG